MNTPNRTHGVKMVSEDGSEHDNENMSGNLASHWIAKIPDCQRKLTLSQHSLKRKSSAEPPVLLYLFYVHMIQTDVLGERGR